jgi:hypothetical protein
MEGLDKDEFGKTDKEGIFTKAVRAGKRTYFFDVKTTRRDDFYLTITESKKRIEDDGNFHFEKHKIFLYKEDFEKFAEGLSEVLDFIRANQPELTDTETIELSAYSNVDFEDIR